MKKKLKLPIFYFMTGFVIMNAQEMHVALIPCGVNATGANGNISFTYGQLFYQSAQSTTGSIQNGIQLPFEIFSIQSNILDYYGIELITTYPNPASDYLILKIGKTGFPNFYYQLFSLDGKLLRSDKVTEHETYISMSSLLSSLYYLRIYTGNREIKTFKIIKK